MKMNIEEKVKNIIVEQLEVSIDKVVPEASFVDDLGADSIDLVEVIMALEEVLGEDIPDEEAEKIQTVQDVTNYIKDHLKTKHFH
jgi:acyl carrier protein